jgi:hypothetical protein
LWKSSEAVALKDGYRTNCQSNTGHDRIPKSGWYQHKNLLFAQLNHSLCSTAVIFTLKSPLSFTSSHGYRWQGLDVPVMRGDVAVWFTSQQRTTRTICTELKRRRNDLAKEVGGAFCPSPALRRELENPGMLLRSIQTNTESFRSSRAQSQLVVTEFYLQTHD